MCSRLPFRQEEAEARAALDHLQLVLEDCCLAEKYQSPEEKVAAQAIRQRRQRKPHRRSLRKFGDVSRGSWLTEVCQRWTLPFSENGSWTA